MLNVTQQDADCISVGVLLLCFDYVCCKEKPSCAYSIHISPPLRKTYLQLLDLSLFQQDVLFKNMYAAFSKIPSA